MLYDFLGLRVPTITDRLQKRKQTMDSYLERNANAARRFRSRSGGWNTLTFATSIVTAIVIVGGSVNTEKSEYQLIPAKKVRVGWQRFMSESCEIYYHH